MFPGKSFFIPWLESIADVRKTDCRGQVELLQKKSITLREKYEILIKLVCLSIGSPLKATKGGSPIVPGFLVAHRAPLPHYAEPTPIFSVNHIRLAILYLLPMRCTGENQ